jgi:hypothetical protein
MEFGETIPLFFIGLCLISTTAIGGTIALVAIYFFFKDKQLAKNIFFTVVAVCAVWFLYPLGQLIYGVILICHYCPESSFQFTWEIVLSTLRLSARSLIFGLPCGYIMAFALVVPIILSIRAIRRKQVNIPPRPPNTGSSI